MWLCSLPPDSIGTQLFAIRLCWRNAFSRRWRWHIFICQKEGRHVASPFGPFYWLPMPDFPFGLHSFIFTGSELDPTLGLFLRLSFSIDLTHTQTSSRLPILDRRTLMWFGVLLLDWDIDALWLNVSQFHALIHAGITDCSIPHLAFRQSNSTSITDFMTSFNNSTRLYIPNDLD